MTEDNRRTEGWSFHFGPDAWGQDGLNIQEHSLFFLLVLPLDIHAMGPFISLNVLETTLAVPYGIELRSGYTAVRCTTCFFCHVLSLFYLSADGMKLFNDYQPIKGTSNNYQFVTPVHAGVQ